MSNIKMNIHPFWRGVFWKIFSCSCFAATNCIVRYLSAITANNLIITPLPTHSILLVQNILGAMLLFPITTNYWKNNTKKAVLKLSRKEIFKLHILRLVLAIVGVALWNKSLAYLSVPEVVAISFIAPVITVVFSVIFLRENLDTLKIAAIICSITGGFFISRPDIILKNSQHFNWYILFPLIAALFFSLDRVITRKIVLTGESSTKLTFLLVLSIGLFAAIPTIMYGFGTISYAHVMPLFILSVFTVMAHFAFAKCYEYAEVTSLLPFGISKVIISALLSYYIFNEIPKSTTICIGIVVLTISSTLLDPSLKKRRIKA